MRRISKTGWRAKKVDPKQEQHPNVGIIQAQLQQYKGRTAWYCLFYARINRCASSSVTGSGKRPFRNERASLPTKDPSFLHGIAVQAGKKFGEICPQKGNQDDCHAGKGPYAVHHLVFAAVQQAEMDIDQVYQPGYQRP